MRIFSFHMIPLQFLFVIVPPLLEARRPSATLFFPLLASFMRPAPDPKDSRYRMRSGPPKLFRISLSFVASAYPRVVLIKGKVGACEHPYYTASGGYTEVTAPQRSGFFSKVFPPFFFERHVLLFWRRTLVLGLVVHLFSRKHAALIVEHFQQENLFFRWGLSSSLRKCVFRCTFPAPWCLKALR